MALKPPIISCINLMYDNTFGNIIFHYLHRYKKRNYNIGLLMQSMSSGNFVNSKKEGVWEIGTDFKLSTRSHFFNNQLHGRRTVFQAGEDDVIHCTEVYKNFQVIGASLWSMKCWTSAETYERLFSDFQQSWNEVI